VQSQLKEVVRDTVEDTLNAMLDAEADRLCNASVTKEQKQGRYQSRVLTPESSIFLPVV
jgi:hypothetical protein